MYTFVDDNLSSCFCGCEQCSCSFYQKASEVQDTILGTLDSAGSSYTAETVHFCDNTQAYMSQHSISLLPGDPQLLTGHMLTQSIRAPLAELTLRVSTFSG